jgi:hypothetical protein
MMLIIALFKCYFHCSNTELHVIIALSNTKNTNPTTANSIHITYVSAADDVHVHDVSTMEPPYSKKRKRDEVMHILAGCFMASREGVDCTKWSTETREVMQRTTQEDGKDVQAALFAISRGDHTTAASAISYFLNLASNEEIKNDVLAAISDDLFNRKVVMGIKRAIGYHISQGSRTKVAETFVKNVIVACLFHLVTEGDAESLQVKTLATKLGTSWRQIEFAIEEIDLLMEEGHQVTELKRKTRCDKILDKLQPYVFDFLIDDQYTRVNTNSKQMTMTPMGKEMTIPQRTWIIVNKMEQYHAFKDSVHYLNFQRSTGSNKTSSLPTGR